MIDRAEMIIKIKALMAKANNGATEAESLAFMNKALELLAKYNIEHSEISKEEVDEKIEESDYKVAADLSWFGRLATVVAEMYFCRTVARTRWELNRKSASHYYCFVGKEHNRLMALNMFDYLMKSMHRLARKHSDNIKDQYEFKKGCATRLTYRIYAINQANKNNVNPVDGVKGLPALYNQELTIVDDHMSGLSLRTRNKTQLKVSNNSFYDGSNAANDISLNNQISGKEKSKFLLK